MTSRAHAFRWDYESHDTVVYHGSVKKPFRAVGVKLREVVNYVT